MRLNQIGRQTLVAMSGILLGVLVAVGFSLATTDGAPCLKPFTIGSVMLLGGCEVEERPCHPDGMVAGKCFIRQ